MKDMCLVVHLSMLFCRRLAVLVCRLLCLRRVVPVLVPVEVLLVLHPGLVGLGPCERGVRMVMSATVKPVQKGFRASLLELACSREVVTITMCRQAACFLLSFFLSWDAVLASAVRGFWLARIGCTAMRLFGTVG